MTTGKWIDDWRLSLADLYGLRIVDCHWRLIDWRLIDCHWRLTIELPIVILQSPNVEMVAWDLPPEDAHTAWPASVAPDYVKELNNS